MKTEIKGDFWGYARRFKLPSSKSFKYPLKSAGIILAVQLVTVGLLSLCGFKPATAIILLMECLFLIGYYVKVLYEDFWNVVLEESKGLFADIIMWVYYFAVCAVSLVPSAVFFMILENHL